MTRKITLVRPSEMFRVFEDSMSNFISDVGMPTGMSVDVNLKEFADRFEVKAKVAGFKKEDIDISFHENMLILEGKMTLEESKDEGDFVMQEYKEGSFKRTLNLPAKVDTENVEAKLEDGLLTLKLPKLPEIMPKKISIQ